MQEFTRGFEASVQEYQGVEFPHADLMRSDFHKDKCYFLKRFYSLKIAQLMSPENFINVVGATRFSAAKQDLKTKLAYYAAIPFFGYWQLMFSEKAKVDENHAIFGYHMSSVGEIGVKVSKCECEICIAHRPVHESFNELFLATSSRLKETGIEVPTRDPSDWCIAESTTNPRVVFFEVDGLDREKVRSNLLQVENRSLNQNLALGLVDRYEYHLQPNTPIQRLQALFKR